MGSEVLAPDRWSHALQSAETEDLQQTFYSVSKLGTKKGWKLENVSDLVL